MARGELRAAGARQLVPRGRRRAWNRRADQGREDKLRGGRDDRAGAAQVAADPARSTRPVPYTDRIEGATKSGPECRERRRARLLTWLVPIPVCRRRPARRRRSNHTEGPRARLAPIFPQKCAISAILEGFSCIQPW